MLFCLLCLCLTSVLLERGLVVGVVTGDPSPDGGVAFPSDELFSAA